MNSGYRTDSSAYISPMIQFPRSPIVVERSRHASRKPIQTIVINNNVSIVGAAGDDVANAEQICAAVANALNLQGGTESVIPSSTGVMGWRLPSKELAEDVVPKAIEALHLESAFGAAREIMTTDRYPKLRIETLSNGPRIVGIAKGAGMVEPNMATMLRYIITNATVQRLNFCQCFLMQ